MSNGDGGSERSGCSATPPSPFAGPWMGGFEGADHVNAAGVAQDMVRSSGHLDQLEGDHRRAAEAGLTCVRESIGWRVSETSGGAIDLQRALRVARSARRHGLQVLWTLMHYGLPDDLCLHDDALIARFERFASAVAREIGAVSEEPPVYTPINEIGFLAWMASQPGHLGAPNGLQPGAAEGSSISGYAVKRRLAHAALAAVHAMRRVDPRARFLHVEPVVHIVPPPGARDAAEQAAWQAETDQVSSWQWQAWDLLAGRSEPGLGGSIEALDIVGVNHYHSSQWELHTERRLQWHRRDARRVPMAALLDAVWRRYRRPVLVAETSHVGVGRAAWIDEMACEVRTARRWGVPVQGLCIYPLTDRPDWNEPSRWHRSGLWHVAAEAEHAGPGRARVAEFDALHALWAWQDGSPWRDAAAAPAPLLVLFLSQRWGPAHQRLQPLARRLAGRWTVVVVEPPRRDTGATGSGWRLDRQPQGPQLDLLVPCHAGPEADAEADDPAGWPASPRLQALLQGWLAGHAKADDAPLVWLTTAECEPLARALSPRGLMWAGEGAPPEAPGGHWLPLPPLPSGVDRARHEASRGSPESWAAHEARQLLHAIGRPRLVVFGSLNADVDLGLVLVLAGARPAWQFVLIGPLAAPGVLPAGTAPNLHWLGEQPHALVPALLAACDMALMPFATGRVGQGVRWPLKLLDSLAAGLPVVASRFRVADAEEAARLRGAGLVCADGSAAVLAACEAALNESAEAAAARHVARLAWIGPLDWQAAADTVHAHLPRPGVPHSGSQDGPRGV